MTESTGKFVVLKRSRALSVEREKAVGGVVVAGVAPEKKGAPGISLKSLTDLKLDPRNANKGTERGAQMIENSFRDLGAGRSILIDKNGQVIAGNKSVEACASIGIEDVVVVSSDGTRLIAVQRTDLDLDHDAMAKSLAIADNRTQQVDLEWNPDMLADIANDIDLSPYFTEEELGAVLSDTERLVEVERELKPKRFLRVLISVPIDQAQQAKELIDQLQVIPEIEIDYSAN